MNLALRIRSELEKAVRILPQDCENLIRKAYEKEVSLYGRTVLKNIILNIDKARASSVPLCQDCGMFWCLVRLPAGRSIDVSELEKAVNEGALAAAESAFYRRSVVAEPVFSRLNTNTNLPVVIQWEMNTSDELEIDFLLKGFGSENCSQVRMLRPTDGEDGVIDAVVDMVSQAGGKPCPPMFLGVGIGGTMDKAALLSKKALLRQAGKSHPDERYARLEKELFRRINALDIGPGGLGGVFSCLSVAVETFPTHIAGLPVALSVNCWADRKAHIAIRGDEL